MTPFDPNNPDTSQGSTHPMITGDHARQSSAVDSHGALATVGTGWPGGPPTTPEILENPMDHVWLLHSFRRRWVLAVGFGLLAFVAVSSLAWYFSPANSTAEALLRVLEYQPTVLKSVDQTDSDFETFQNTQVQLITSQYVLSAALRDPLISQLRILRDEEDPIIWLQKHLRVAFSGDSEVLDISLAEQGSAEELRLIVDAVTNAYLEEVVNKDRRNRTQTKLTLENAHVELMANIRKKEEAYIVQIRNMQTADSEQYSMERELAFNELYAIRRELTKYVNSHADAKLNLTILQQQISSPLYMQSKIDEIIRLNIPVQTLQQQVDEITSQIAGARMANQGPSQALTRLLTQKNQLVAQLNGLKREIKRDNMREIERTPDPILTLQIGQRKMQLGVLELRIQDLMISAQNLETVLKSLGEQSAALNIQKAELEQLRLLAQEMGSKIEAWNVEDSAPRRIQSIQLAFPSEGVNGIGRYVLVFMAGLFGFAVTGFAVAFVEFQSKRLNEPSQIDKGLGIRVVGTLPSLAFRGGDDGEDLSLDLLTESIDGVRTTLMHDSSSSANDRRVVLVTSANGHEGRTTVASQLAASLARAGRRTVLVDGDFRDPSLHTLFDVPLEDGFCEVLRTEAEVADVVRPTHAEGLWLLTAGYCDASSVQALARDQVQPIFDHLRANYDFVIIDGAPVLELSDALIMGQYVDSAILSVVRDFSQVPKVYKACELLRGIGIRVLGAVVNGVQSKPSKRTARLRLVAAAADAE